MSDANDITEQIKKNREVEVTKLKETLVSFR